jgi:hypothetical protein
MVFTIVFINQKEKPRWKCAAERKKQVNNTISQATLQAQGQVIPPQFFDNPKTDARLSVNPACCDRKTAEQHIRIMLENFSDLRDDSTLEFRYYNDRVKNGYAKQRWVSLPATDEDLSQAINFASKLSESGWGCFLGMNPRQGTNGDKENVKDLVCVYADVDLNKTSKTKEEVYDAILELAPDLVTWSGNGFHAIWFFSAVEKTNQSKVKWLEAQHGVCKRLKEFGADPAVVTDEARVLRWVGFPNNKAEYETPQPTAIVYQREGSKRSFTDIVELLAVDDDETDSLLAKENRGRDYSKTFVEHGNDNHESRNRGMYRDLCSLRGKGMSDEVIELVAQQWNLERCDPPMSETELANTVKQACKHEPGEFIEWDEDDDEDDDNDNLEQTKSEDQKTTKKRKKSSGTKVKRLVEIAESAELFRTPGTESNEGTFATVPVDDHFETFGIQTQKFRSWLLCEYRNKYNGNIVSDNTLRSAAETLSAKASFNGVTEPVFIRVARKDDKLYYDLGDAKWKVVEIDTDGWRVLDKSPVKFIRPQGYQSQVEPTAGGRIDDLRKFISVRSDDQWVLLVGWLISVFEYRDCGGYAILNLKGTQDAAKTTTMRMLRSLVDPTENDSPGKPNNEEALLVAALNSWLPTFDNFSKTNEEMSDAMCRLSTGGGLVARKKYSDHELVSVKIKRATIVNGIGDLDSRPDLADRTFTIDLPTIDDDKRRSERDLFGEYNEIKPKLLGAIFDAISCGLRNYDNVSFESIPRMADLTTFVTACESALAQQSEAFNKREKVFAKTYADYNVLAKLDALEASIFGMSILKFLDKATKGDGAEVNEETGERVWMGSAEMLLEKAKPLSVSVDLRHYPNSPRAVSAALRRLYPSFKAAGYKIELPEKATRERTGKLERTIRILWNDRPVQPVVI